MAATSKSRWHLKCATHVQVKHFKFLEVFKLYYIPADYMGLLAERTAISYCFIGENGNNNNNKTCEGNCLNNKVSVWGSSIFIIHCQVD